MQNTIQLDCNRRHKDLSIGATQFNNCAELTDARRCHHEERNGKQAFVCLWTSLSSCLPGLARLNVLLPGEQNKAKQDSVALPVYVFDHLPAKILSCPGHRSTGRLN